MSVTGTRWPDSTTDTQTSSVTASTGMARSSLPSTSPNPPSSALRHTNPASNLPGKSAITESSACERLSTLR
ncbi:PP148 [Orf virus]|uniref:PP148 n=1 Tax=Orf virus TaxID=10258 RepID=F1AWW4_ORFV|nr:PP148 [Orf virus]